MDARNHCSSRRSCSQLQRLGRRPANTVNVFSLARLAGGLAIGIASALTPVYIAEIAPSKNRGTLVSLNQLAIVVGILCAYLVNWQLSKLGESSWRWMLALAALPSVGFFLGLLVIPESPRLADWAGDARKRELVSSREFSVTA